MKIVLIPTWVEENLKHHEYALSDALNPEILMSILSKDDVAFYLYLNIYMDRWFAEEIVNTFDHGQKALGFTGDTYTAIEGLFISHAMRLGNTDQAKHTISSSELFGSLTSDIPVNEISFTTRVVDGDTIAVIPFHNKDYEGKNRLMGMVDDLLYHLSGRMCMEKLALTPLFKHFVANVQ